MYQRVIVPLDGSELAAQALPYGRVIVKAMDVPLVLFRAVPSLTELGIDLGVRTGAMYEGVPWPAGLTWEQLEALHRQIMKEAVDYIEMMAARLRAEGLSVETVVVEGPPAESLIEEAGNDKRTLIVMTTHGRSGIARWWSGSVTEKVVREGSAPTMVIRCQEDSRIPDEPRLAWVILPLDGSEIAERAIPHAVSIATTVGAALEVVQAVAPPSYLPIQLPVTGLTKHPKEARPEAEAQAREYLTGVAGRLREMGIGNVVVTVAEGDAASVILEVAAKRDDSMIVMSTHGHSGIRRWSLGGTVEKAVRHSGRPVLVVRAREEVESAGAQEAVEAPAA